MHFQGELVHFFPKNEALRSESVKVVWVKIEFICFSAMGKRMESILLST